MSHHEAVTASVSVGIQDGGGLETFEFGFVTDRVLRDAASRMTLSSLDARVKLLSILLRISGTFTVFEGQDVENVRFGRGRSYISVDWLYAERFRTTRDFEFLISLVLGRLRRTPAVIADVCGRRSVSIDRALLTRECEEMGKIITNYATDKGRFDEWKERMLEIERQSASGFKSYF
jgi:hypothetical protein